MPFRRRRDVVGLAVGAGILAATGALARRGVAEPEAPLFHMVNGLPGGAFPVIWVPMQYGTFGTVPVVAAVSLARGRTGLAVAVGAGGTAAWCLAKAAKPGVSRGRPENVVPEVHLRGREEGDQGFPSGHAAVSAAITVVASPYLTNGWRVLARTLAAFVPIARLYVGAHLPLDSIGGSALGVAVGSAVNLALGTPRRGSTD